MKKFVARVFLFSITSFILLFLLDWVVSCRLRRSSDRVFASWYDLMHGRITSDVIVLGNSRAWVQISPMILDSILHCNSYNLGIDGSSLNRQITKYEIFRQYNKKPDRIILSIDFFSFGFTQGYESYQYFPYFSDVEIRKRIFPQECFSWAERWLPFYRYSHLGLNNIPRENGNLTKGFHAVDRPWDGTRLNTMSPHSVAFDERTLNMFTDFLSHAQKEGIQVILVLAPIYFKAKDYIQNYEQFEFILEEFRHEYSLPLLRYDDIPICRDTSFFYNATHLNMKGAEIFSRQLASDLLRFE